MKKHQYIPSIPLLLSQWHKTKNKALNPYKISIGSHKRVWWKCSVAADHEWQAEVRNRAKGHGCPFCSGRYASSTHNLSLKFPDIAKEWDFEANGDLNPENVTPGSFKKVYWRCRKDKSHKWQGTPSSRTGPKKYGCPFCSGHAVSDTNSLLYMFPEIASQWDHEKNKHLTPDQFTGKSGKKVWWQCPKHLSHTWQATITNRTHNKSGCPFCAGKMVCETNALKITHPQLAEECVLRDVHWIIGLQTVLHMILITNAT